MEPVYIAARVILVPLLRLLFRFRTVGRVRIPRRGPAIVAPNHISNFDPLCIAYLIDRSGRRPRFLGKASLWRNPLLRFVLEGARQIPVHRGTGEASPMVAAEAAIRRGEVVVLYPEGTITTDRDLWPMRGKTGVARLALSTGAPVYPVAVWGPQWIAGKGRRGRYFGHRLITFNIGEAMTFPDLDGRQDDAEVRREVTDRVMSEVDRLVRELRKIHPDRGAVPPRTRGKS
ncbi:MAG: lysophospholipid acyltransferase family protein [Actinomycetota bacterium]